MSPFTSSLGSNKTLLVLLPYASGVAFGTSPKSLLLRVELIFVVEGLNDVHHSMVHMIH